MPRILHIDDQKLARIALQSALDPFGFEIEQADGGVEGLRKALSGRWDLILLDVEMPEMDGPTVLRLIRARDPRTPIALVTSVSSTAVLTATIRLGATSYFPKSLPPPQLRAAIAKLLKVDPPRQDAPGPRVLVRAADEALARALGARLPAHVQLFTESEVEPLLEACVRRSPGLVLFDARVQTDGLLAAAAAVRALAPTAGIFLVRDDAPPGGTGFEKDPIDGAVTADVDPVLGYELLYLNFLRPLVFVADGTARAATFQGDRAYHDAYFRSLGRQLLLRASRAGAGETLRIDLRAVPDSPALVPLIARLSEVCVAAGAHAWFDVRPEHEGLKAHPALGDVFFV